MKDHAGSKKFVSPLEAILLAPVNKATVSTSTHRLLTEIVADLTYMYGGEKGCEGLPDLWKKVKLPQEPEVVRLFLSFNQIPDLMTRASHFPRSIICIRPTICRNLNSRLHLRRDVVLNLYYILNRVLEHLMFDMVLRTLLCLITRTIFDDYWKNRLQPRRVRGY
jgi:hypothetical protein